MNKSQTSSGKTYDVVESAIDLSKVLRGTWKRLIREKAVRPWAAEIKTTLTDDPSRLRPQDDPAARALGGKPKSR